MSGLLVEHGLGGRAAPDAPLLATAHRRALLTQAMLGAYTAVFIGSIAWAAFHPFASGDAQAVIVTAAFLLTAVAFAMWKVAAYRLVPALSGAPTERTPGWAAGGYFIPVGNLWIPYQIMREISDGSDPGAVDAGLGMGRRMPPLRTWWALWIGTSIFEQILRRVPEPGPFDSSMGYDVLVLVTAAATLALTVVAFLVVRQVDEGQRALAVLLVDAERARAEPAVTF